MSVAEIEIMSVEDQLDAMGKIWSALNRNEASVKSREWHNDVLSERKRKIESGTATFYSLDEVKGFFRGCRGFILHGRPLYQLRVPIGDFRNKRK
jgi:hypothetical protein